MTQTEIPVLVRFARYLNQEQDEKRKTGEWIPNDIWIPNAIVLNTFRQLIGEDRSRTAFDPWAANGILLTYIIESGIAESGLGYVQSSAEQKVAYELSRNLPVNWEIHKPHDGPTESERSSISDDVDIDISQFDLVVSLPPWGYRIKGRDIGRKVLLEAWNRLTPSGIGAALVTRSFMVSRTEDIQSWLISHGLYVDAIVDLPPGTFAPQTQLSGSIIIVRRGEPRPIFCARLTGNNERDSILYSNFCTHTTLPHDVTLGVYIDPEKYSGLDPQIAEQNLQRWVVKNKSSRVTLGELICTIVIGRSGTSFMRQENAIYIPLTGKSPAFTQPEDMTMRTQNYAQILVNTERVVPQWLAGYLSSPVGLLARETAISSSVIRRFTKLSLPEIPIFLPPLSEQREAVTAAQGIRQIREQLSQLDREVWTDRTVTKRYRDLVPQRSEEQAYRDWLAQIPFPLASILWTDHTTGNDYKDHCDHLLHFFEAAAEFHALILLSAITNETDISKQLIPELGKTLKESNLTFQLATFGTWKTTVEFLTKRLRILHEDKKNGGRERIENILKTDDRAVLDMLLGKSIPTILQLTNSYRNDWKGHDSAVSDETAHTRYQLLVTQVQNYREAIGDGWSNYDLIIPSTMKLQKGQYVVSVEQAKGFATPFPKVDVVLSMGLEEKRLHLLARGRIDALKLLPLVQLKPSPKTAANACYFYNRTTITGQRFVSYHFEQDAEISDVSLDVKEALEIIDIIAN